MASRSRGWLVRLVEDQHFVRSPTSCRCKAVRLDFSAGQLARRSVEERRHPALCRARSRPDQLAPPSSRTDRLLFITFFVLKFNTLS